MPSSRIPLLLGTAFIGTLGSGAKLTDASLVQKWIDIIVEHGQPNLDSARVYGNGTSEKLLSQLDLKGARIDTKVLPREPGDHAPSRLKELFNHSLEALGPNIKIRVFYLHAPDRSVPYEETLEVVNDFYKQGYFEEFGLSNYASWEVAEIVGICKRRGFVLPTVYQGVYNLIYRVPEAELFPCLRKNGIRFAAYSVLGGGMLTGKLLDDNTLIAPGSHFDPGWYLAGMYVARFGHAKEALRQLKAVAEKHDLQLTDVAYRWLQHHSVLIPEDHGVIVGASTFEQLEKAIVESEKGPLPKEVVEACEATWQKVKGAAPSKYWV